MTTPRLLAGLAAELRPLPLIASLTAVYPAFIAAHYAQQSTIALFLLAIALLSYAVHALDTYEDFFVRKEDEHKQFKFGHGASGLLTRKELVAISAACTLAALAVCAFLASSYGTTFLAPMLAAFAIGLSYSSTLSKNMYASLLAYPVCIVLAMEGAFSLAGGGNWASLSALAAPAFLLMLSSRVWMEAADAKADSMGGKPNLANEYGVKTAKKIALALFLFAMIFSLAASFSFAKLAVFALLGATFAFAYLRTPIEGAKFVFPAAYAFLLVQALTAA